MNYYNDKLYNMDKLQSKSSYILTQVILPKRVESYTSNDTENLLKYCYGIYEKVFSALNVNKIKTEDDIFECEFIKNSFIDLINKLIERYNISPFYHELFTPLFQNNYMNYYCCELLLFNPNIKINENIKRILITNAIVSENTTKEHIDMLMSIPIENNISFYHMKPFSGKYNYINNNAILHLYNNYPDFRTYIEANIWSANLEKQPELLYFMRVLVQSRFKSIDRSKETIFIKLCKNGYKDLIELLLKNYSIEPFRKIAFHVLMVDCHPDLIKWLICMFQISHPEIIHHYRAVKFMVKKGNKLFVENVYSNVIMKKVVEWDNYRILTYVIKHKQFDIFDSLIKNFNVTAKNVDENKLIWLQYVFQQKNYERISYFLKFFSIKNNNYNNRNEWFFIVNLITDGRMIEILGITKEDFKREIGIKISNNAIMQNNINFLDWLVKNFYLDIYYMYHEIDMLFNLAKMYGNRLAYQWLNQNYKLMIYDIITPKDCAFPDI